MKSFALSPLAALLISSFATAQRQVYELPPTFIGHRFAKASDVNGDGRDDFVMAVGQGASGDQEVTLFSGRTGLPLHAHGPDGISYFGLSVAAGADVDGDGTLDYAACGGISSVGEMRVFSGASGAVLHEVQEPEFLDGSVGFGNSVELVGDWNGDGRSEFAVGAPGAPLALPDGELGQGQILVFSGADAGLFAVLDAGDGSQGFGADQTRVGDVDGDGLEDLLVGGAAQAWTVSAASRRVLHAFLPEGPTPFEYSDVAGLGDVDLDGVPDVAVGSASKGEGWYRGEVRVHSGADGTVLHEWYGDAEGDLFGHAVAAAGDVDGDGRPDVLVGAPQRKAFGGGAVGNGYVRAFSGADGSELFELRGDLFGEGFGATLDEAGDTNGDGVAEFALGTPWAAFIPGGVPRTRIFSTRELALTTDVHSLSTSAPGVQAMSLHGGEASAGDIYLVLGSLSGTAPGLPLGFLVLPLVFDAYTSLTLVSPNQGALGSTLGVLDGNGGGAATWTLPAESPSATKLTGLTAHHAFVVLSTHVELVSNSVPLTFVP